MVEEQVEQPEDPSDDEPDLGTSTPVTLQGDPTTIAPATETVVSVLTAVADGSIDTQPTFQRREIWDDRKKASLIESVFLGLPLPLFYLADAKKLVDGEEIPIREVVDGQQRLSALRDFYRGALEMPEDSIVTDLRGKHYADLRPALQSEYKNFKLSTATIPLNVRADKFELFKRLNQKATVLSQQELRNAAFHGDYLNLLQETASDLKDQLRITDAEWNRMKDVEYLTRIVAFDRSGPSAFPNKRLNEFLNSEMTLGAAEAIADRNRRMRRAKKALERTIAVFGDLRFRPFRITESDPEGEWAKTLNRALMEVQVWVFLDHASYGFADADSFDRALNANRDEIIDFARRLHAYNERFNDTLQRGTTGKPNVEYRFERYRAAIRAALAGTPPGQRRRFFSHQDKQNLWDRLKPEQRVCSECQRPLSLANAEVDHVKPFAEGGETVLSNAQLIHPACNRAKGMKWDPILPPGEVI